MDCYGVRSSWIFHMLMLTAFPGTVPVAHVPIW